MNDDVCIVGGGYSGTMTAAQLVRRGFGGRIYLVDRTARPGRGVAYSPPSDRLVLNVPARNMGAWADDPAGFHNWLTAGGECVSPTAYVSREWYGRYLEHILSDATERSSGQLRVMQGHVVSASRESDGYRVRFADGRELRAGYLVLALGNLRPGPLPGMSGNTNGAWWCPDPWTEAAHRRCRDGERILIVGSGLTMVDMCVSLCLGGARPRITVLSRNGLLPCIHATPGFAPVAAEAPPAGSTLRQIVKHVRAEARRVMAQGGDWRAAVDCLRPVTPDLWSNLSTDDKRRFLRSVRAHWDVHRHRVPPEVIAKVVELRQRGCLRVVAGRIRGATDHGPTGLVSYAKRGSLEHRQEEFDRVINCTGARTSIEASPLLQAMSSNGLVCPEPIGLGIQTDHLARAQARGGTALPDLWVLGPLRRGTLWETSAVPDLRGQVASVAEQIMLRHTSVEIRGSTCVGVVVTRN